ncbi:MAG: EamA family transporter [Bacteroidetes bacterium]|nr:EamA family transporter [Bacteroidota bacterium]
MNNNTFKAHLSLFAAQVIYALNYSIAKDLMPLHVQPLGLVMLRITGACILFWTVSVFIKTHPLEKKDFKHMMLLALFGVAVNQGFFIYGLSLTKPINSAIIMVSNPIVVIVFTWIIAREKITVYKLSGLLLGIVGAMILLLFKGSFSFGSETVVGDIMTLINSLSWAVFIVMSRPFMQKYHTVTVMKWVFLFGFIFFAPFGTADVLAIKWSELSAQVYFAIGFVIVATTFLAYFLNTYALKTLSSSVVSMYIYAQPFLATLFAMLMGKDNLTPIKILSGCLIIAGVYLASMKPPKKADA